MGITVTSKGSPLDVVADDMIRDLKAANKKAAKAAVKGGTAAMRKGAPVMWGKRLSVTEKITATATSWTVELSPSKGNAGGWAIQESGAQPHLIKPRKAKVLRLGSETFYAHVNHPGTTGNKAWTKAGARLAAAIDRDIADVYDEVFEA